MRKIGVLGMATGLLVLWAGLTYSQGLLSRERWSLGLLAGGQRLYGDVDVTTSTGPGLDFLFAHRFSPSLSFGLQLGYTELRGSNPTYSSFFTELLTAEVRALFSPFDFVRVQPLLTGGVGAFNFQYMNGDRYFDGSVFAGPGLQVVVSPRLSLLFLADYHLTGGDDIDGSRAKTGKDGYLAFRGGVVWKLAEGLPTELPPWRIDVAPSELRAAGVENLIEEEGAVKTALLRRRIVDPYTGQPIPAFVQVRRLGDPAVLAEGFADAQTGLIEIEVPIGVTYEITIGAAGYQDVQEVLLAEETEESAKEVSLAKETTVEVPAGSLADSVRSRVEQLESKLTAQEEKIETLRRVVEEKHEQVAALQREMNELEAGQPTGTEGTDFIDRYKQALQLYMEHQNEAAIRQFAALANDYPTEKRVSNCYYWMGEAYFVLGHYRQAASYFEKVLDYPDSYKLDDALLMLGRSHMKLGDADQARYYLQRLIDEFPSSEYLDKARKYVQQIGS